MKENAEFIGLYFLSCRDEALMAFASKAPTKWWRNLWKHHYFCVETYRSPQALSKARDCWGLWAGQEVRTQQTVSFVLDIASVVGITKASYSQWEWRTGKTCMLNRSGWMRLVGGGEATHVWVSEKNVTLGPTVHKPPQSAPGMMTLSSLTSVFR